MPSATRVYTTKKDEETKCKIVLIEFLQLSISRSAICKCRPGFLGLHCEAQIKECMSNPCSPVGTAQCEDLDSGYQCKCNPGFVGEHCETDVDDW